MGWKKGFAYPHCVQIKRLYLDQLGGLRSCVIIVDPWPGTAGAWTGAEKEELAPVLGRHRGLVCSVLLTLLALHLTQSLAGEIPASQSTCDTPCEKTLTPKHNTNSCFCITW